MGEDWTRDGESVAARREICKVARMGEKRRGKLEMGEVDGGYVAAGWKAIAGLIPLTNASAKHAQTANTADASGHVIHIIWV
jgi:hypothetical protein